MPESYNSQLTYVGEELFVCEAIKVQVRIVSRVAEKNYQENIIELMIHAVIIRYMTRRTRVTSAQNFGCA